MSFPLFKLFIKKNWKLWSIFTGVLIFYLLTMILIFDQLKESMNESEMMGIEFMLDSRFGLLASSYFDMLIFIFPMVFYILLSNKLVSKTVDDSSMSAFLSSSLTRRKYITTAAAFFAFSIFVMFFAVFAIGGATLALFESYSFINWTNLVFSIYLCTLAIAAISFFFSTAFAATRLGSMCLIGLPIMFVLFNWLGEMPVLDFLNYLTPIGYIEVVDLAYGLMNLWWLMDLVFVAVITVLFVLSIAIFNKKQLSI